MRRGAPRAEILMPICRASRADELKNDVPAISRRGKRSFQFARNVLHGDVNTTLRDSRLVRFAPSTLSDVISGPERTVMVSSAAVLKAVRLTQDRRTLLWRS